jgi:hypothetical protein
MVVRAVAWLVVSGWICGLLPGTVASAREAGRKPRVVYPKKTELDFEGAQIEGEIRNPGELYFQRRPEEKFDSLVKPRRNFHPEVMRDVLQTR